MLYNVVPVYGFSFGFPGIFSEAANLHLVFMTWGFTTYKDTEENRLRSRIDGATSQAKMQRQSTNPTSIEIRSALDWSLSNNDATALQYVSTP